MLQDMAITGICQLSDLPLRLKTLLVLAVFEWYKIDMRQL
jgi:hypothetical protein